MIERLLIVGLGSIGERHLRLARELLPHADIRVLRRASTDVVPENANGCFFSLEEAIAFEPQAAVLANPASLHATVGQSLAQSGCHLLVEKPLTVDRASAKALTQACENGACLLQVGYNLRFSPSLLCFKNVLDAGAVGDIWSIRCEVGQYLPSWRPDTDYRCGVSAQRALGGGVLLELSHEIDYLRWLFGDVQWVSALLGRQSDLDVDVEDLVHLTLGFAPHKGIQSIASVNMDFIRRDPIRVCSVIGAYGTLRWDAIAGRVDLFDGQAQAWEIIHSDHSERDAGYRAQWQAFLGCVCGNGAASPDGRDGLAVLEIIEAARQSDAAMGQRVQVLRSKI